MRRSALVVVAVLLALVYAGYPAAVFLTDWRWFESMGLLSVFNTVTTAEVGLGLVAGLAAFAVIQGNAALALRNTREHRLRLAPELASSPLGRAMERTNPMTVVTAISAILALVVGLGAAGAWEELLLFINGGPVGWSEPILGHDAGFYMFTLPFLRVLRALALAIVVLSGIQVLVIYATRGAVELEVAGTGSQSTLTGVHALPGARTHVGALVAGWLVVIAAGQVLARYGLLLDQSGLLAGPGYTEVTFTLPLLTVQVVATLAAGAVLFVAIARQRLPMLVGGAVLAIAGPVATGLVPGTVERVMVLPNELELQTPYLAHHIEATRVAFGLDAIDLRALSGDARLTWADIEENGATVGNIRLWDHEPLLQTFSQTQEIRTYYDFPHVDNDRYVIDGQLRQTMLSAREIKPSLLPDRARTWVNEEMTYTHGYGVALGPVNTVTRQGLPELWVQDLPPRIRYPDPLRIDRPELYFGESMDSEVFVGTDNEEFDYPTGDGSAYTTYAGAGGMPVGGLFWKSLLAVRLGASQILFTREIRSDSRVLLYRELKPRVRRIAPYLHLDSDPYLVIDQGRLVWILDAYTTSSDFPYAQAVGRRSYMRSSVKVTIDAYDGTVTFYVVDEADPVLAAWRRAFPDVYVPLSTMPESLRAHLRYPSDLFAFQAYLYATYHMTDPQVFYNREDEWEVPFAGATAMEPYYTVLELPGETEPEFILMMPFVPKSKPNLAAWMIARCDGDAYGEARVYRFPKDKFIYGPNQAIARFNQDDTISEKLSLWSQAGSKVLLGTLLVIPIEESLIYVQPLYLKADTGSIPELKRVIVGDSDENIAMAPTLEGALRALFAGEAVVEEPIAAVEPEPAAEPAPVAEPEAGEAAEAAALRHYEAATRAARDGDWATYGAELDALGEALQALQ